jgi:hypothetical protein
MAAERRLTRGFAMPSVSCANLDDRRESAARDAFESPTVVVD